MTFTIDFIYTLAQIVSLGWPVLLMLVTCIVVLAFIVGRIEDWTAIDSVYYGFITATTVGYGDFRPTKTSSKLVAIAIALIGMMLTGIVVALAFEAVTIAAEQHDLLLPGYQAGGQVNE